MFEDLINKLNAIDEKLSLILDLYMQQTNNLTTYKDVAKFLGKTPRTINNYIRKSKLVANKHYYKDENGKTVFVPQAIMEFKHASIEVQSVKKSRETISKVMHPIASSILNGVA